MKARFYDLFRDPKMCSLNTKPQLGKTKQEGKLPVAVCAAAEWQGQTSALSFQGFSDSMAIW